MSKLRQTPQLKVEEKSKEKSPENFKRTPERAKIVVSNL
jgi:hypothetical protein